MTRLFKKPLGKKGETSQGSKSEPLPSRFLKKIEEPTESKREKYLKQIEVKIFDTEKALEAAEVTAKERMIYADKIFQDALVKKQRELAEVDNSLMLKRSERTELEKPLTERVQLLNDREGNLLLRESTVKVLEQKAFEREHQADVRIDDVKNLADELGENRIRLSLREKAFEAKEKALNERETQYLAKVERFNLDVTTALSQVKAKEDAIQLRELNIQSKEENLVQREEQIVKDKLFIQSRRQALLAAKKYG